jgi:hypothetical protein
MSCSELTPAPPIDIEKEYLNQQILLRAPNFSNSFNTLDRISLELKYNSNREIVFPNNFNLKMFIQTNEGWMEINERPIVRLPPGDVVFSPSKMMPAVQVIYFSPELPSSNQKYKLRIYVIGSMKEMGESIKVAAFTDIELHP